MPLNAAEREKLKRERGRPILNDKAPVRIALAYPNRYEVGMASLGFQTVYRLFNEHPQVRCERVFLEDVRRPVPIRTFESGETLNQFDLVGFSVSFELDMPNVIRILIQSKIPPLSRDRNQAHPIVFLGGAIGGLNPSPLLPFLDGLLAGEGEDVISKIADILLQYRRGNRVRENRLEALSELEGVFIPGISGSVHRLIAEAKSPAYTPMVTPLSHFSNMFVVETGRGCPKGCLFCAACKISHPFRPYPMELILETVRRFNPGAPKVGLEGAGLSDYPHLMPLCLALMDEPLSVSFSSIRADRISKAFLPILERSGIRSFTIAPEAGGEAMRRWIGKGISDSALMEKVGLLSESGITVLKLYYLIGLPGETEEDIDFLIQSVKSISDRFLGASRNRRIRLSVNAFVPKPFTEFQWAAMDDEKELTRKRKRISEALKNEKRLISAPKSAREEILQGILSAGDERVGTAFLRAVQHKTGFRQVFAESDIAVHKNLFREKRFHEPFPWDFIRYDVPKEQLWDRFQKGRHGTGRIGHGRS